MSLWSMSVAFRLGLGFHALNNEGADGSNLMQPRRIDVGELTYDGISGEIIRRHILENLANLSPDNQMLPLSAGLHPDRGPIGIRAAARIKHDNLKADNLYESVREAIQQCAILDAGGFLAAFGQEAANDNVYIAEAEYLRTKCAPISGSLSPIKRETCFDVGWLISEEPQDLTVTQHSAFRDTAKLNSRYAQTVRSNVYGGIVRADLHRIGTDDHWYLSGKQRVAVSAEEQYRRQSTLINSIVNFIASPTGAKTAAWAPHVFLTEGVILLTSARTAPFISPIKVDLREVSKESPVSANTDYADQMQGLANDKDTWVWRFGNIGELLTAGQNAVEKLGGNRATANV